MSEVREKLSTGEQVMVSAATTGELERLADICHEYEVPYRLGESKKMPRSAASLKRRTAAMFPA